MDILELPCFELYSNKSCFTKIDFTRVGVLNGSWASLFTPYTLYSIHIKNSPLNIIFFQNPLCLHSKYFFFFRFSFQFVTFLVYF